MENSAANEAREVVKDTTPGIDLDMLETQERKRILIVEDDPDTVSLLKLILRRGGYDVISAGGGKEGLEKFRNFEPDLVLLDLMMPDMDGWEMFSQLKQISAVPVIILSAVTGKEHVVRALQLGVDDYLTKPFYNDEVTARVQSVLRRAVVKKDSRRFVFPAIGLVIDSDLHEVLLDQQPVRLAAKEFTLLETLARSAPAIVSYATMAQQLWGEDMPEARARTKYLVYLVRKKLERVAPGRQLILNIGRLGYKLQVER